MSINLSKRGFTLVELLIVITILGIISLMAVPNYLRGVEMAKNKEAESLLRLIVYAEKMHNLQYGNATSCPNTNQVNSRLGLEIVSLDWDYTVDNVAGATFDAHATRQASGPDTRVFTMDEDLVISCASGPRFCP